MWGIQQQCFQSLYSISWLCINAHWDDICSERDHTRTVNNRFLIWLWFEKLHYFHEFSFTYPWNYYFKESFAWEFAGLCPYCLHSPRIVYIQLTNSLFRVFFSSVPAQQIYPEVWKMLGGLPKSFYSLAGNNGLRKRKWNSATQDWGRTGSGHFPGKLHHFLNTATVHSATVSCY